MSRVYDAELQEMGIKTILIFEELLGLWAEMSCRLQQRGFPPPGDAGRAVVPQENPGEPEGLRQQLNALRRRVESLERRLDSPSPRRSRRTRVREGHGTGKEGAAVVPAPQRATRGGKSRQEEKDAKTAPRLARTASRQLALQAALRLQAEGKPITLAAVARAAGLKYSQVVYAFQKREELLKALALEQPAKGRSGEEPVKASTN